MLFCFGVTLEKQSSRINIEASLTKPRVKMSAVLSPESYPLSPTTVCIFLESPISKN